MSDDIRPYGSWPSPISADDVAAAGRKFSDLNADPADPATLYWNESRPEENGRCTLMRQCAGAACETLLEAPYSARSAVHEYGGGSFAVHAGVLWFVNAGDQAIYRRAADGAITRYSQAGGGTCYADLQFDAAHDRLIAVTETPRPGAEPEASLVSIDATGQEQVIAEGHDFYASPRLSSAGDRLVWLAWNHPDMPWDATQLWQARIDADGRFGVPECRQAGAQVSLFGPFFDPNGRLYVVSDADNWWNIQREDDRGNLQPLTRETAEFGLPQWVFGQSTCAFAADGRLYALASAHGSWQLGEVDTRSGAFTPIDVPATHLEHLRAAGDALALVTADAATPPRIVRLDPRAPQPQVVRATAGLPEGAALARPEAVSYPTADGDTAHALFYAPTHAAVSAPPGERPPLIIKCHGGPTGATSTALDARIQYWTSRGFAVLDVNYRGSTGYGRAYRQKLTGAWGVADVADCVHGAAWLDAGGRIDARRVLVSGSSAGGYTVLCVLTFTDLAAAGASYYGIGDLERLLTSTHKFESRYLKRLIGDDAALLAARSPLHHAEQLRCPVLFLQGLQDKVVPPDQAETMVAALRARSVPVAYVTFAEERHGFRNAANIRQAIESERIFYARILGLENSESLIGLEIDNL